MSREPEQEVIALRAYRIWEEEGRPDGRHEAHWSQARLQLDQEDTGEAGAGDGLGTQQGLGEQDGITQGKHRPDSAPAREAADTFQTLPGAVKTSKVSAEASRGQGNPPRSAAR